MRATPEALEKLGPLVLSGELDTLRERMLAIWPPDAFWRPEDVDLVTTLLRGAHQVHGAAALPIYVPFAERLQSPGDHWRWLQSLDMRAEIVATYEGHDRAAEWLGRLAEQVPPPNNGAVDLVWGRLLMVRGEWAEARGHLSRAVAMSLRGIEWYRLEAINEMCLCLVRLGENRLAFEYARTHSLEKYKLGRIEEGDLYKAVHGNSLSFGQIDYAIDLKRNLARKARQQGDPTWAALHESDAGFRLAQLGLRDEALPVLLRAAADAERGRHPGDPCFSLACRLLAHYLAPGQLRDEELLDDLHRCRRYAGPVSSASMQATEQAIHAGAPIESRAVREWQDVCTDYLSGARRPSSEIRERLVLVHLAALLGRHHAERGHPAVAEALLDRMTAAPTRPVRDAIFLFVREDRAEQLLGAGHFRRVLELCRPALGTALAHERFVYRQLAARASASLRDGQEAWRYALLALGDWKRVLEGLYDEKRKVAWLQRGAACLACAINALRQPVDWMPEPQRRRELFRLTELGRARLVTDMVSHAGHLPGAYLVPEVWERHSDVFATLQRENPDWFTPVVLQLGAFADGTTTFVHDDGGRPMEIIHRDVRALRGVVQLPLSPEKRLYASADALPFEDAPAPGEGELYTDLMRFLTPSGT